MFFADLTPYTYGLPCGLSEKDVLNVGWLSSRHLYPRGMVDRAFREKLAELVRYPDQDGTHVFRGFHTCEFCWENGAPDVCGYFQIRVPGKNGIIYSAPTMVDHYVIVHGYLPPAEFIDAVMKAPVPSVEEYKEASLSEFEDLTKELLRSLYVLDGQTPRAAETFEEVDRWRKTADFCVAEDIIGDFSVRTEFTVRDYRYPHRRHVSPGPPLLFKTEFGQVPKVGDVFSYSRPRCRLSSTWDEAEKMHARAVELVRSGMNAAEIAETLDRDNPVNGRGDRQA